MRIIVSIVLLLITALWVYYCYRKSLVKDFDPIAYHIKEANKWRENSIKKKTGKN